MHKVLRTLIISDFFILGSLGLIQPIFAIFMLQNIAAATITSIGVAIGIQMITKSILQIGVASWTDAEAGNRRELYTLFVGALIISAVPFGYVFATNLTHVYLLQFVAGVGAALAYPGWMVIFMRYTRHEKAGYEWGVYNSLINIGTGVAAFFGAYMAEQYSFRRLFVGVGVLSFIGAGFIIKIFKHEFTRLS